MGSTRAARRAERAAEAGYAASGGKGHKDHFRPKENPEIPAVSAKGPGTSRWYIGGTFGSFKMRQKGA